MTLDCEQPLSFPQNQYKKNQVDTGPVPWGGGGGGEREGELPHKKGGDACLEISIGPLN